MDSSEIDKFIKFLEYYKDKYYTNIYTISLNNKGNTFVNDPRAKYKYMYSFDKMCKDSNFFIDESKKKYSPKSTDGIYYINNNEKFELYFIEFKGDKIDTKTKDTILDKCINELKSSNLSNPKKLENAIEKLRKIKNNDNINQIQKKIDTVLEILETEYYSSYNFNKLNKIINNLENVKNKYFDSVLHDLLLKPFESINITLPGLYEEYCEINNISPNDKLNINKFLNESEIYLDVVVVSSSPNRMHGHYKKLDVTNSLTYENILLPFYWRFKKIGFIKDFNVYEGEEVIDKIIDNGWIGE